MPTPKNPRPIEFHQLCAIARTVLQADPTIDDTEWKERTKTRLTKQGYAYPSPELLSRALGQVEHAMATTMAPRLVTPPTPRSAPTPAPPQQDDPPWKGRPPLGWTVVARMVHQLAEGAAGSSRPPPGIPAETLTVTEGAALDLFYARIHAPGADVVQVLRVFAELAIVRPAGWDTQAVRDTADDHRLRADGCAACRSRRDIQWHHIVQIQFGGSNTARNRIALCARCHAAVHPWLGPAPPLPGWTSIGNMAAKVIARGSKTGAA